MHHAPVRHHLLCGLAANPTLPPELVDRLVEVADDEIADALALRTDLTRAQAKALTARVPDAAVRLAYEGRLAALDIDPGLHPDAALALLDAGLGDPDWAHLLVADPTVARRERLAACPGLPTGVVRRLATDPEVRVVTELALWTTSTTVTALAAHPHAEVRRAVAVNEETPPQVLAALMAGDVLPPAHSCLVCDVHPTPFVHESGCDRRDCDLRPGASCDGSHGSTTHDMLLAAAGNPATPAAALVGFVDHPSTMLRRALAVRPDLPAGVYRKLATDADPWVRDGLAANPAIGEALMRRFADDLDHGPRRSLAHNPRVPLDILADLAATTKIGPTPLPRIAAASSDEIEDLARSADPAVRRLAAQRRDLPAEVRDTLAFDADAKVVNSVASHPGLSESQLRAMLDRHGVQVAAGVAAHPAATAPLLHTLAHHTPPVRKALRAIARHPNATAPALLACLPDPRARPVAAGHPALPPRVVTDLLTDPDTSVAAAAAANPSLPSAVMRRLLESGGRPVSG